MVFNLLKYRVAKCSSETPLQSTAGQGNGFRDIGNLDHFSGIIVNKFYRLRNLLVFYRHNVC